MKRRLTIASILLILGAVVNILVAWSIAVIVNAWTPPGWSVKGVTSKDVPPWEVTIIRNPGRTEVRYTSFTYALGRPDDLPADAGHWEIDRWVNQTRQARNNPDPNRQYERSERWMNQEVIKVPYWSGASRPPLPTEVNSLKVVEVAQGWPMRSMIWLDVKPNGLSWGEPMTWQRDPSGRPHVLPLKPIPLGFTMNTALFASLLWLVYLLATLRRRLRMRRSQCLNCGYPIGVSAVCTECGKPVRSTNSK